MEFSDLSKKKRQEFIQMLNQTMEHYENNIERRMAFSEGQEWSEIKKSINKMPKTSKRIKKEEGER